ncbi:hypothetical protein [Paenibacillus lupini]|uniref:hypothetical protein n=1 Tax=Paenibacillus lupini TaxID=1450204 RepID=UPI001423B3B6|nr:hypothetical protein [Paenibacillus lupini]NIK26520.1 hypothetical protein [Paenibacillus lupini]
MRRSQSLSLNSPGSGMMESRVNACGKQQDHGRYIVTAYLRNRVFKRVRTCLLLSY